MQTYSNGYKGYKVQLEETINIAKQMIEDAEAILITAGAGMGVDSGLPDFRGEEGFWRAYPLLKDKGLHFEDMATPKLFKTDPSLAWAFYGQRLNLYRATTPHKGFDALKELVHSKNNNYFIYTSNVDGQFQKAGFDEEKIVEVHGSIHHLQCVNQCKKMIWSANETKINVDLEKFLALNIPSCPYCGSIARPNILMFGDWSYWNEKHFNQQKARYLKWLKQNKTTHIVVIEIGAGTAIPTIRYESERVSKQFLNAYLIRINPYDSVLDKRIKRGMSMARGGLEGILNLMNFKIN
jgi:NAD-dependent SIR2 family protein deacetylase